MCIVFFLGAWYIFVELFIYHLIRSGTQFFLQPISFSPFSVIGLGLRYCSVGEIIGFVIGLLISVASPKLPSHHRYHLAEIMVTSFANLCPHSKLFNLFLVKRAYEPHQNKEIFELKEQWKTKTSLLSSQTSGHFNTRSLSHRLEMQRGVYSEDSRPPESHRLAEDPDIQAGNCNVRCQG